MRYAILMFGIILYACVEDSVPEQPVPGRWYTAAQVSDGGSLYQGHCAVCHGADGSATAEWRTPDTNGVYPPPPLDGSAHTWHHPLDLLEQTIVDGGAKFGGVMPGFGTVLDRDERRAIIAWCQSLWSNDIYERWKAIDQRE
jgi:mono/diheme cytochrome c family protein